MSIRRMITILLVVLAVVVAPVRGLAQQAPPHPPAVTGLPGQLAEQLRAAEDAVGWAGTGDPAEAPGWLALAAGELAAARATAGALAVAWAAEHPLLDVLATAVDAAVAGLAGTGGLGP